MVWILVKDGTVENIIVAEQLHINSIKAQYDHIEEKSAANNTLHVTIGATRDSQTGKYSNPPVEEL